MQHHSFLRNLPLYSFLLLYVLYSGRTRCFNQWQRALYPGFIKILRGRKGVLVCRFAHKLTLRRAESFELRVKLLGYAGLYDLKWSLIDDRDVFSIVVIFNYLFFLLFITGDTMKQGFKPKSIHYIEVGMKVLFYQRLRETSRNSQVGRTCTSTSFHRRRVRSVWRWISIYEYWNVLIKLGESHCS